MTTCNKCLKWDDFTKILDNKYTITQLLAGLELTGFASQFASENQHIANQINI